MTQTAHLTFAAYCAQRIVTHRAKRRVWAVSAALVLFALLGIPLAVWLSL